MISVYLLTTAWLTTQPPNDGPHPPQAVSPPATTSPAKPPPTRADLEARVAALEDELGRLRLQAPESEPGLADQSPAAPAAPANVFNPTLTVIGDSLYRYDDRPVLADETRVDGTFNLREVELDLRAAVDPFADGVLIAAFPSEVPGEFGLEIEEGYVNIKRLPLPLLDEPPLGLKLKLGRFRTEVGRINRLHLHDLPQVNRPLVTDELFGEDGYIANGLSAQLFVPTPFDEESAVELTLQALTGGGSPVADGPARSPALVSNLRWFRTFAEAHNVDLSLVFHFGRTDPGAKLNAYTYGPDFLYKWKPLRGGEFHSFVLGGQLLAARRESLEGVDTNGDGQPDVFELRKATPLGYFAFAQWQAARTVYLGARWDDAAAITEASSRRRAASGYLTWYASEFLRFRFGYQHMFGDVAEEKGRDSAFAELTFIFGAHPPEPFWVNK